MYSFYSNTKMHATDAGKRMGDVYRKYKKMYGNSTAPSSVPSEATFAANRKTYVRKSKTPSAKAARERRKSKKSKKAKKSSKPHKLSAMARVEYKPRDKRGKFINKSSSKVAVKRIKLTAAQRKARTRLISKLRHKECKSAGRTPVRNLSNQQIRDKL